MTARQPVLEGKTRRRVDPAPRKAPPKRPAPPPSLPGLRRSLDFHAAGGRRLTTSGEAMSNLAGRIRGALAGLKMPWALKALDHAVQQRVKGRSPRPTPSTGCRARNMQHARGGGPMSPCAPPGLCRSRRWRASTSASSRRWTVNGSRPWPSSTSSTAPGSSTAPARRALERATWPPPRRRRRKGRPKRLPRRPGRSDRRSGTGRKGRAGWGERSTFSCGRRVAREVAT